MLVDMVTPRNWNMSGPTYVTDADLVAVRDSVAEEELVAVRFVAALNALVKIGALACKHFIF